MKTVMWKRIVLILVVFLFAAGCAYWTDRAAYQAFNSYDAEADTEEIFSDASDVVRTYDCKVSGGYVMVTGDDPQFVVNASGQEFSRIHIVFLNPVIQETSLQIFYVPAGGDFSEDNSVHRVIAGGSKDEIIQIPGTDYTAFRFDFEHDVNIDKIYAGRNEHFVLDDKPHIIRLAVVFSIIFVPLCALIFVWKKSKIP